MKTIEAWVLNGGGNSLLDMPYFILCFFASNLALAMAIFCLDIFKASRPNLGLVS